ncbi:MAG: HD domain-containing protein [Atopobiaceae bacterium]|nr:HD domain-containing protein [Atopobiaceae bacterium]
MIYTDKTKAALRLAYEAHAGQADKSGLPYIHHPLHLAEQMDDEDAVCVALLHDVVEDTDVTFAQIRGIGMSDAVMEALELLTHGPEVPYLDYVARLAQNDLARRVKIADLRHNSDLARLDKVTETDLARVRKYERALEMLGSER